MRHLFVMAIVLAPLMASAAYPAETAMRTPAPATDANARVPAPAHNPAFGGYRPYLEQAPAPWREVNDDVHRAGGHPGIFGGSAIGKPPARHPPGHNK